MGGYDSKRFSKLFSERTIKNLDFISNIVKTNENLDELFDEIQDLKSLLDEVEDLENSLSEAAMNARNISVKKNASISTSIRRIESKIREQRTKLGEELSVLRDRTQSDTSSLFEITQLLNSMMGVAVLPFEMHKEIFDRKDSNYFSDNNIRYREIIKSESTYKDLEKYIMKLKNDGKWNSTYHRDNDNVVFGFLKHLRNTVSHSGDGCLCILPLDNGEIITNICFYDSYENMEFAMNLSVDEFRQLFCLVGNLYSLSTVAYIDKTDEIKCAEKRIKRMLNM